MTLQRVGRIPIVEGGGEQRHGFLEYREFLQSVDLANALASTGSSQSIAITGIAIGDIPLFVDAVEGLTAGVAVVPLGPTLAANVVVVRVLNPTVGAIDAAAANFRVGVLHPADPAV